jgi:predicted DNA-binding transcriptional regulator AlpA
VNELRLSGSGGAGVERAVVSAGWAGERELVEEIAELVAERVAVELGVRRAHAELIDAREVARILGCRRSWVYEHKAELPVVRLGSGSRPRLRFDRAKVEAMAGVGTARIVSEPAVSRIHRRRLRRPTPVRLLEIKGRAP